jgi:hypothetical protein
VTAPISDDGEMWIPPCLVASHAYVYFRDHGEWPNVRSFHHYLAEHFGCPVEVASYDTLNALNTGDVYGLPSVVAMRLGEAHGDWTQGAAALGPDDNGFRIAVPPAELEPRHPLQDYEARYQRRLASRKAAA